VDRVSSDTVKTEHGSFEVHSYKDSISGSTHLAFTKGEISVDKDLLVRVHIPNTLRDVCEVHNVERTSWSFSSALKKISEEGAGVAVLLSGKDYGRDLEQDLALATGNELIHASRPGHDLTIGTGSQILRDLGVGKMRLLSYPAKFNAVTGFDLEVVDFVQFDKGDES
jgi:3,4-dihydroxy 2-butanone 4-phosphate synthase/GTP cyclohydrolase II